MLYWTLMVAVLFASFEKDCRASAFIPTARHRQKVKPPRGLPLSASVARLRIFRTDVA